MNKSDLHKTVHFYCCCAIAFFLSFKFLIPIFIILLLLNWFSEGNLKNKFTSHENKSILLLFIAPYCFYLIGMLYSANTSYGFADLQTKLSLMLFPLVFSTTKLRPGEHLKIGNALLLGVISASLFLVSRASYYYFTLGVNYFFYVDFSNFLHPSYFGLAVNLCILVLLTHNESNLSGYLKFILVTFLTLIIFLLSSKLALLSTLLIFIGYGINFILQSKRYKTGITLLILLLGVSVFLVKSIPELEARIQNTVQALTAEKTDKTNSESSAVRILVWKAASDAFLQNGLLGVGTGDVKDELFSHYKELGYTGALEHKLNAHNQFLQTGIALGYLGFALLLSYFLLPIFISWQQKNYLFVSCSLLIAINCLTESMLEAEAGVIFIAFFQSHLFFRSNKELR